MKTKLVSIILLLIMLISSTGCNFMCKKVGWFCPERPTENPNYQIIKDLNAVEDTIDSSTDIIGLATKDIKREADSITKEATEVQDKVPAEVIPAINSIKKSSDIIKEDATKIEKASAKLIESKAILKTAEKKVSITQDALDKIEKERDEAIEARDSALHKTLQWIIAGCVIGCGAFIALFFFTGNKGGIISAGGCGLVLVIAIFVDMYISWLAISGGILLIVMVGWLLYNIYIKNKAFKEIVDTVEVTKTGLTSDKKEEIFGKDGEIGLMNKIQSPSTINLVKKEKSKMSLWNSMKNKKE